MLVICRHFFNLKVPIFTTSGRSNSRQKKYRSIGKKRRQMAEKVQAGQRKARKTQQCNLYRIIAFVYDIADFTVTLIYHSSTCKFTLKFSALARRKSTGDNKCSRVKFLPLFLVVRWLQASKNLPGIPCRYDPPPTPSHTSRALLGGLFYRFANFTNLLRSGSKGGEGGGCSEN